DEDEDDDAGDHRVSLVALVAVGDRERSEPTAADGPGHGRIGHERHRGDRGGADETGLGLGDVDLTDHLAVRGAHHQCRFDLALGDLTQGVLDQTGVEGDRPDRQGYNSGLPAQRRSDDEAGEGDEGDDEDDEGDRAGDVDDEGQHPVDDLVRVQPALRGGEQPDAQWQSDEHCQARRPGGHEQGLDGGGPHLVRDGRIVQPLGIVHQAASSAWIPLAFRALTSPFACSVEPTVKRRRPICWPSIVSTAPARIASALTPALCAAVSTSSMSVPACDTSTSRLAYSSMPTGGRGPRSLARAEPGSARTSASLPDLATRPSASRVTESQISRMTDISWVMMSTVMPRRSRRERMRPRIWSLVDESSAEVGSSHSSTLGSAASARAMPTRCFCPPESWAG